MLFCFLIYSYLIDIFLIFLYLKIFCILIVWIGYVKMLLFSVFFFDFIDYVVNIEDRIIIIVIDVVIDWNIYIIMK